MSKTCPSCEEGHHERCRDESCDCCGSPSLNEMFGGISSMKKPGDEQLQASDMTRMKQNLDKLSKDAQGMQGNILQKPDGQMALFRKNSKDGELPLVANLAQGTWDQQQGALDQKDQKMSSQSPTMGNVFSPK